MLALHFIGDLGRCVAMALLLFVGGFRVATARGTEPLVRVWQTEQGLPQNSVRCILQTGDGFLWIGTDHGLARFDGVKFQTFNSANTAAFKSDHISALAEDDAGNLWVGSQGGGVVCLGRNSAQNFSTSEGLSSDMVNCVVAGDRGVVWIGTIYGLNCWKDGKRISGFAKNDLPGTEIKVLSRAADGTLWIGTERGLAFLRDGLFRSVAAERLPVDALAIDLRGDVWIGGKSYGLLRMRAGEKPLQQMLPLSQVVALAASRKGEVWAALKNEGLRFFQNGKPDLMPSPQIEDGILCLYEDREKNLWAGMNGGGLARLKEGPLAAFTLKNGLLAQNVSALAQDREGRIWAGGKGGGLALFQDGRFQMVDMGNRFPVQTPVLTLCSSADGSLWIGTQGNGLFRWKNGNVTVPETGGDSPAAVITALLEDHEGALWIGTEAEGILRFKDRKMTRLTRRDGFSRDQANCIAEQPDGSIWFGTASAGVNRWKSGRVESFSKKNGLASDAIQALHADSAGMVWIGTGAGLTLFREGRFFTFTQQQGLHNEMVSQIAEGASGNFWLGSNRGLFRVQRQDLLDVADGKKTQLTAVRFGTGDGMPSSECIGGRQNSTLKDASGKLWFATLRGLVRFDANEGKTHSPVPRVVLERVLSNDKELVSDLNHYEKSQRAETISVPPGKTKLEFHFTAASFRSPEKILFRYKLEGFDPQWIQSRRERSALYTKVPKGNYVFRVAASSDEAVWGPEEASIKVRVLPFFWETAWFKSGLVFCGAMLAFGMVHLRKSRRRELEQLRLRIAGDLHDELGSNLSGIGLLSRRVGKQPALGERERSELNEIGQIAAQTTEAVRDIIWFINPACDSLDELLQRMKEVTAQMLAEIPYRLVIPESAGAAKISPEFRRNLLLAFKETLHNIVTHSEATHVEITIAFENGRCLVSVCDNGKGFDTKTGHRGNGLKNIQLRMAQLGGMASLASRVNAGTQIRLEAKFK